MANSHLDVPATAVQPNLDLFVIDGALWVLVGSTFRALDATESARVAEFVANAADALADAQ